MINFRDFNEHVESGYEVLVTIIHTLAQNLQYWAPEYLEMGFN